MADFQDRRPIHLADAPFNDSSGDIILRCGTDRLVDFRTHKIFLAHASPVFETMFSLPQEHQGVAQTSDVPIVFMPDDAENLRTLLLYCYPGTTPETPSSLEELYRLYRVADKYALDDARGWVRHCLPLFMEKAPIGVYVLARELEWKAEAEEAAKRCRAYSLLEIVTWENPILSEVSASSHRDLLRYHRKCSQFLTNALMQNDSWLWKWYWSPDVPNFEVRKDSCCRTEHHVGNNPQHTYYMRSWWEEFVSEYSDALNRVPSMDKIPLADIFCKISKGAGRCPKCGPVALDQLREFESIIRPKLADQVDAEIQVPVE